MAARADRAAVTRRASASGSASASASRRRALAAIVACAATACAHDSPFTVPDTGSNAPFQGGSPARLTWNVGRDADPSWSPDGTLLIYAAAEPESHEGDECAAVLPATGGRIVRRVCRPDRDANNQIDYVHFPALNAQGDVALVAGQHILRFYGQEGFAAVVVRGGEWRELMAFPRTLDGQFFVRPDGLAWLAADSVVVLTGGRLILLDAADSLAAPTLLPTAPGIIAVSAGPAPGSLFLVHAGDDNIYLYDAATGAESVRFTFGGPEGIGAASVARFGAVLRVSLPGGSSRMVALDCAGERPLVFADTALLEGFSLNPASGSVAFAQFADLYLIGNAEGSLPAPACAPGP